MAKIKNVYDCKTPGDFEKLAYKLERQGKCQVEEGSNHTKVKVPGKGCTVIKRSGGNQQLCGWLLKAMIKQWKLLGLAVVALAIYLGVA